MNPMGACRKNGGDGWHGTAAIRDFAGGDTLAEGKADELVGEEEAESEGEGGGLYRGQHMGILVHLPKALMTLGELIVLRTWSNCCCLEKVPDLGA